MDFPTPTGRVGHGGATGVRTKVTTAVLPLRSENLVVRPSSSRPASKFRQRQACPDSAGCTSLGG